MGMGTLHVHVQLIAPEWYTLFATTLSRLFQADKQTKTNTKTKTEMQTKTNESTTQQPENCSNLTCPCQIEFLMDYGLVNLQTHLLGGGHMLLQKPLPVRRCVPTLNIDKISICNWYYQQLTSLLL